MENRAKWGNTRTVRDLYGVAANRLSEFVAAGWVRVVKLGQSNQSSRLYCLSDVEAVLRAKAEGREPSHYPQRVRKRRGARGADAL